MGEKLYRQGKATAARQEFARAVRLAPNNKGMRTRLAWLLLELKDPAAAREHFRRLLQQPPVAKDVYLGAALSEQQLGQSAVAWDLVARGRQKWPQDLDLLRLQADIGASLPGKEAEVLALYQQLQQVDSSNPQWRQRHREAAQQLARRRYQEATAALVRQEQQVALQALADAVRWDPDQVGYRTHYGWLLLESRQPAAAAQQFEMVLQQDPGKKDAYLGLALARSDQNDLAGAIQAAQEGLQRFPEDKSLLEVLAGFAARQPATRPLALATYERLAALEPDQPQWLRQQANIYLAQGRVNQAERLYRRLAEASPPDPEAALELARLQAEAEAFGLAA